MNMPLQNVPGINFIGQSLKDIASKSIENIKNSVANTVSGFAMGKGEKHPPLKEAPAINIAPSFAPAPQPTSQFNISNTMIAKLAFLIIVIIVFMFFLDLGISLIIYLISPANSPYLVKGMIDGATPITIPQDPKNKDSKLIVRSNNQSKGLEFTWSVWLYINDLDNNKVRYQHIFSKGDNYFTSDTNIANINNAPGLYLGPNKNNLHLIMNGSSQDTQNNIIDINNIPLRKWVHVAIRAQNTILDVYVNGTVANRLVLQTVPKQNYNDVFVCQNGGFNGKLSNLRYFSKALNVFEINTIVSSGPNLTVSNLDQQIKQTNYNYLSNVWYSSKL